MPARQPAGERDLGEVVPDASQVPKGIVVGRSLTAHRGVEVS